MAYSTGEMGVSQSAPQVLHKEKPLDFSRGFDVMQGWLCDGSLHGSHFFLKQFM